MSEININAIPIPIKYSKSYHSFSNPHGGLQNYYFELIINPEHDKKVFRKINDKKHAELINEDDVINYNEIKSFKLLVSKVPFDMTFNYELEGYINQYQSSYNQRDENIYIEFSQNSSGITYCNSSFIGVGTDFSKICISPPN